VTSLQHDPNLTDPDHAYARLIAAHADLTLEESAALNARLVLLLANHIGSEPVLAAAIDVARQSIGKKA
jgi:hypothetical protein